MEPKKQPISAVVGLNATCRFCRQTLIITDEDFQVYMKIRDNFFASSSRRAAVEIVLRYHGWSVGGQVTWTDDLNNPDPNLSMVLPPVACDICTSLNRSHKERKGGDATFTIMWDRFARNHRFASEVEAESVKALRLDRIYGFTEGHIPFGDLRHPESRFWGYDTAYTTCVGVFIPTRRKNKNNPHEVWIVGDLEKAKEYLAVEGFELNDVKEQTDDPKLKDNFAVYYKSKLMPWYTATLNICHAQYCKIHDEIDAHKRVA